MTDYSDARDQLRKAEISLDDMQNAVADGRASAVSPVDVIRLRIELGVAYARLSGAVRR